MPENNAYDPGSFMHVLAQAKTVPDTLDMAQERDALSLFPKEANSGLISPSDLGDPGIQVDCIHFSEVLTLWRPWETCYACKTLVMENNAVLPAEGTYECPHNNAARYHEVMTRCLSGKGVISTREYFNLKNGTRAVHIEWLEADPAAVARMKKEEAHRALHQVYPPNPDAAFARNKNKK